MYVGVRKDCIATSSFEPPRFTVHVDAHYTHVAIRRTLDLLLDYTVHSHL